MLDASIFQNGTISIQLRNLCEFSNLFLSFDEIDFNSNPDQNRKGEYDKATANKDPLQSGKNSRKACQYVGWCGVAEHNHHIGDVFQEVEQNCSYWDQVQ